LSLNSKANDVNGVADVSVCVPDDVGPQVRAWANAVGRSNIGGLDCIGDGQDQLAANSGFATVATVLKVVPRYFYDTV